MKIPKNHQNLAGIIKKLNQNNQIGEKSANNENKFHLQLPKLFK